MFDIDEFAVELRAAYWTALGDPERAEAEPSPESKEAWIEVAHKAYGSIMGTYAE